MPKIKIYDGEKWITFDAQDAETLGGKPPEDYAPSTHVGAGGEEHAQATVKEAGFLGPIDKAKLDKINIGNGEGGTVAILDNDGRVKDSQRVGGKNLLELDARYRMKRLEAMNTVYTVAQKEIPINVTGYDPRFDILEVYQDGFRITQDINFILDPVKLTINLKEYVAEWGTEFTFVVYKGVDSSK